LTPETVWIRLVPQVAVEGKTTLVLDFSKPLAGLTDGTSAADLGELFTFTNGEGTTGANEIRAVSIKKDSEAVYTLTVEHVPDVEKGIVLVTINREGIAPPTRAWSLDGVVYEITVSRSDTDGILGAGSPYTCETVLGSFAPELNITLSNQGATPTGALNVALSGDDAEKFTLSSTSLAGIAAGGAVKNIFYVQPDAGLPLDSYTAVVTISSNGIEERFTINYTVRLPYTVGASAPKEGAATGSEVDEYVGSDFYAVAKDADGCTYAVGYQSSKRTFTYGANVSVTGSSDFGNAVIVKYDRDGAALWAKSVQSPGSPESEFYGVATDKFGNVYAVGAQFGSLGYDYGNGITGTGCIEDSYSSSIVKYNSAGEAQWAKSLVSGDYAIFYAVAADGLGNVYAVGIQGGRVAHNFGGSATSAVSNSANLGGVIVKYKSDTGAALWARSAVGVDPQAWNDSRFYGVAADALGNVYVAGHQDCASTYDYGGAEATAVQGSQNESNAVFVKYDGASADGKALWAKVARTGAHISRFLAIAADGLGNLYAAGFQCGGGTFDYGGASAAGVSGGTNAVIVKYESGNGAALWAKSISSGGGESKFNGVAADALGNVYAVGFQQGNSSFNYGAASTAGPFNSDTSVIVKYNSGGDDEAAVWAHAVQGNTYTGLQGIAADGQGGFSAVGNQSPGTIDYGNGAPITVTGENISAVVVGYR
jgi:hypothetical protein